MKQNMKQRLQHLKPNHKLIWIAVIHWILTFFTDHLIFEYVMWDLSNVTQMVKTAMTYGAKAVFLLVLIGIYQGLYVFFTKADKKFVRYSLIYFGINMVLLLLTWPGIWRMDEFGILNSATMLLPVFWQNYLTSLFYVFSLMLIPIPSGVIIVQCALISLIVGYVVNVFVKNWGRLGLLAFVPCLFLPVLDSDLYPMRMSIYGFLELFLLVLLWEKKKSFADRGWGFLCILVAVVTAWRTEAVYYFVLFPLLLVILYAGLCEKKKLLRVICGYLICALCLFVPQTVGDKLTSGNQYDLTSVVLPLVPLVNEAYGREDCEAQLKAIDQVIDVEIAVQGATEGKNGISLFWSEPDFQRSYTDEQYRAFKGAYYDLICKFPGVFLEERLDCFLHSTDLLQNTTELFSATGVTNYDTFRAYTGTTPISEELRNTVIKCLEWRTGDYETKKAGYGIVYSALPPIAVLFAGWLWCLIRRKWQGFFLLSLPLVKLPLVFLTAPSRLFMYYYPLYLIGYFMLAYAVVSVIDRVWRRVQTPVRKTIAYGRRNGIRAAFGAAMERVDKRHQDQMSVLTASYQGCREWSRVPDEEVLQREKQAQKQHRFPYEPLISIVVPAYETDPQYLQELIDSVKEQTYPGWELIIADASKSDRVRDGIPMDETGRIRYIRLKENLGISDNTNVAIEAAEGDYIALLDHDDILTQDALYSMVEKINQYSMPEKVLGVYSDEDKCDSSAVHFYEPHLKPDFNLDLLLSNNYICHFLLVKAAVMKELKLRREYDGAQDYDLILRLAQRVSDKMVLLHVPKVLYHWRCHEGSTAGNTESKRYAYDAGRRALEAYFTAVGLGASVKVTDSEHLGFYRTVYLPDLFEARKDVAAICGRVIRKNIVVGSPEGMFDGLRAGSSGYLHRAALYMDVKAADVRALRKRPDLDCSLEEALARGMRLVYDPDFIVQEHETAQ